MSRGLYVDNLQGSSSTEEDILKQFEEASKTFSSAGMNLREWSTNSPSLRNKICKVDSKLYNDHQMVKFLGLVWNVKDDSIGFPTFKLNIDKLTKRSILSCIARVFDPMGLLTPITIRARMYMQKLWSKSLNWDDLISDPKEATHITEILEELKIASEISVPRFIFASTETSLHIFCDASQKAY